MMHFLDTNIYRNLVRNVELKDIPDLVNKIKKAEVDLNISAGFPIVVAMELINHLDSTDPHCNECFKALCLLFDHSKNYNTEKNTFHGSFFPPLNVILPKYFFKEDGPFLDIYKVIISLTSNLTTNHDINNIKKYTSEIKAVSEQILFEKQEIHTNIQKYLKEQNNGILDWEYFGKNKNARQNWFKDIKTGAAIFSIAEGFMIRAYGITGREYQRTDENFRHYKNFYDHYYPAIAMTNLLLVPVGHGTTALSDVRDYRWNTVNDISMMFGALFNSNIKRIIFVTEEKKMHEFFGQNGMNDQILNLLSFQSKLNL